MPKIVDIHCHVLPGVDDGPSTMAETVATLKTAARQGIGAMIVTPHFHPGRYVVYADRVLRSIEDVRGCIASEGIPVKLIAGQECYFYSGLLKELDRGNVLTMAGSSCVLVEFDPDVIYTTVRRAVQELTHSGYRPIIAHYERYRCLYGAEDKIKDLRALGAKMQLNFNRLLGKENLLNRNPWRRQLKRGLVDYLGSDTHGMAFRPLQVDEAVRWMQSEVSPDRVNAILGTNVRRLLQGRD